MARLQLGVPPVRPDDAVTKEYSDSGGSIAMSIREVPTGDIDGVNAEFRLEHTPNGGTETVYMNGLAQQSGVGDDYTISGPTITFPEPPPVDTTLSVTYWFTT